MFNSHIALVIRGYLCGLVRRCQPWYYSTLLKWKARWSDAEIVAPVTQNTRFLYHNFVIRGRDGFLFHRDHDVIEQLTGAIVFRQRQIDVWLEALAARASWCAAHDCLLRTMIIPEKHVVYQRALPWPLKVSPNRPVMQLLAAAGRSPGLEILYPLDALREANGQRDTFLKTDTHWTAHGAFAAYRVLAGSLAPDLPVETVCGRDITWSDRQFTGDLGVRLTPEQGETISTADPHAAFKLVFQNHNYGRGAVHVYESDRHDLPRCVLFRDSFSNALIPFLMRSFSRIVAVSSMSCHYDLLEFERPDVVLFILIERFAATFGQGTTIELPQDVPAIPFAAFSGTGLDQLGKQAS